MCVAPFGCYDEGPVAEATVLAIDHLVAAGATGISLADSAGLAYPHQVKHLAIAAAHSGVELALHLPRHPRSGPGQPLCRL